MPFDLRTELAELVVFNTVNDPRNDQKPSDECATHITSRLEICDFETKTIESNGYLTSFAKRGDSGPKILFLAHYDVVPPGNGWSTDPFTLHVEGDIAYGRGTCDDKGNIVSMLLLAELFNSHPLDCTLLLAMTGDEEIGGANGASILADYLQKSDLFPDHIIVADGINQVIIHRRRNVLPGVIKAKQKLASIRGQAETVRFETQIFGSDSRHSAYQRPGVDRHALLTASKYLDLNAFTFVKSLRGSFVKSNVIPDWVELEVVYPDDEGTEIEYDQNLTGLVRSLLPLSSVSFPAEYSDLGTVISPNLFELEDGEWTLYCDIRSMTNDGSVIEDAFRRVLESRVDIHRLKVYDGIGYVNSDPDSRLIRAAEWVLTKEGIDYKLIEGYGASDSRYFTGKGADLFDFGPRGGNVHGPNEWVSLSSIRENAQFFYLLADTLSQSPSPFD